ncbi:MAG: DUF1800 family protein [Bacteroidota bacterium]
MASLNAQNWALGTRLAAHLLRRCSYHYTRDRIDALSQLTAPQAVADILQAMPSPTVAGPPTITKANTLGWWMYEALQDTTIHHKMTFFLHTLFVVDFQQDQEFNFQHLRLLDFYSLGNVKEFAKKMCLDNRMVVYLDSDSSNSGNPNENFAREFLELFTIGKGNQVGPGDYTNYTEHDVQQAARIFTGLRKDDSLSILDADTGIPRASIDFSSHDTGDKTFSSAFGSAVITGASSESDVIREISDFVEMVFAQDETAKRICRRIYRFFVSPTLSDEVETDIITPLASALKSGNYELQPIFSTLLSSIHFNDQDDANNRDEMVGVMFKSPLDLVLQTLSFFKVPIPDPVLDATNHYTTFFEESVQKIMFEPAGLFLFEPELVAGYPAYYQGPDYSRIWFKTSSVAPRYQVAEMLTTGTKVSETGGMGGSILDMVAYVSHPSHISDPSNAYRIATELLLYVFAEYPQTDRFDYFLHTVFLNQIDPENWTREWEDYQSSGDATEVNIQLNTLITALIASPEYQLL